ncbi:transmembrane protein 140 [Engystomops pustulosus]|uniref:transmembrane protein 140 n=1 Tax=Engystomops pustulosus TaxID=76066 RepID=UPI003AFABD67
MVGWQKTCLSLRCLGHTILLAQSLLCLLLVYALILGGGNILIDGCKKIGFYNYCFQNITTNDEDCHCVTEFKDLHWRTIPHGLMVSLILTYSSLVIIVMGFLTLALAHGLKEDDLWNIGLGLNVFSLVGLVLGMTSHLFLTWDQFDFSHVTPGFLALLMAIGGLCLQLCLVRRYIRLKNVWSTSKAVSRPFEDLTILVA